MNIRKTNPLGVELIEKRFHCLKNIKDEIIDECKTRINNQDVFAFTDDHKENVIFRHQVFSFNQNQKVLRLTENVVRNCKLINIQSIKENININDFDFTSATILLENDSSGLIKIERSGSDFDFLYLKNLKNFTDTYFNTYSFLTKEFYFPDDSNAEFVIQVLAYLYYGEITTKVINRNAKVKINTFSTFLNNSKLNITYVDSLWKQRICVNGFQVRGHFRMQPFGQSRQKRKLIWIEEFSKDGYNRKATRELCLGK